MRPKRDEAPDVAAARGFKEQGKADAPILPEASADAKRKRVSGADLHEARLRAAFDRHGFKLLRLVRKGKTIFAVSRWDQVREFATLAECESFLAQVTRGRA